MPGSCYRRARSALDVDLAPGEFLGHARPAKRPGWALAEAWGVILPENNKPALAWQAVVVVAIVVGAVTYLAVYAMGKYQSAADAATLLAVVISPLVAIGAAAFGVKLSADAKAATADAKAETASTKGEAAKVADALAGLSAAQAAGAVGAVGSAPGGPPTVAQHQVAPLVDRLREISR